MHKEMKRKNISILRENSEVGGPLASANARKKNLLWLLEKAVIE
jgi:hypothetical protein